MANIFKSFWFIIQLLAITLLSVLCAVAMPSVPASSNQVDFFPHQEAFAAEHTDVHFAARAPQVTVANVVVTGASVAEHGNGVIVHGHDTHMANLSFDGGFNATNSALDVPGRVQSRINLASGPTRFTPTRNSGNPASAGWDHVVNDHFGGGNTQSQFTLSQSQVRGILRSDRVVSAPVTDIQLINGTPTYVRTVDVGQTIGTVRQSNGGGATSVLRVQTDSAGNLITAYPVP